MSPEPLLRIARPSAATDPPPAGGELVRELEAFAVAASPDSTRRLLLRAFEALEPQRAVLTSGLGMEGCALLDLAAPLGLPLRVVFLDTGFHFPETLALLQQLQDHYPALDFESVAPAASPARQAEQEGDALWRREPDRCCALRKVEPLALRLVDVDLWISAIGRSQAPTRAAQPVFSTTSRFGPPKLSPLAAWRRADVWRYVRDRKVPIHPLHGRGYPSISCRHCTLPVPGLAPGEYSRAGRWSASAKTECGLHSPAADAAPTRIPDP